MATILLYRKLNYFITKGAFIFLTLLAGALLTATIFMCI